MKRTAEAFAYPFSHGNGPILLLGIVVLSLLTSVFSLVPLVGGSLGFVLQYAFIGYLALYLRTILQASMEGREQLPPWPDWQHPDEFLDDVFSVLAPFAVSFLPLLLLRVAHDGYATLASPGFLAKSALPSAVLLSSAGYAALSLALLILGWLYLPMAILVWTYYGGWSILNPVAVARTAWRTGPSYLGLVATTAFLVSAAWSTTLLPGNGIVTTLAASTFGFYALVVSMRLLGTHYHVNRERLGWDRQERQEPV